MKATAIVVPICVLATVSLAVCLVLGRQACLKLDAQNDALRRELSKRGAFTAENQRLSNLVAQAKTPREQPNGTTATNVATDGGADELARLRSEVEALSNQSNEVVTLLGDTQATFAELKQTQSEHRASRMAIHNSAPASDAPFEVLQASYSTGRSNMDVSAELNDRIRDGSLKAIAGNNLAGDPDFGTVKNLTVVYRSGGMILTNQFHEGDVIDLPPQPLSPPE